MRKLLLHLILFVFIFPGTSFCQFSDEVSSSSGGFSPQIQTKWKEVLDASLAGDLGMVAKKVNELQRIKIDSGFDSLEPYSLELLARARENVRRSQLETANYYLKMAFILSPRSPRAVIRSLDIVRAVDGNKAVFDNLIKAVELTGSHPILVLHFVKGLVYPFLWAVTLGLFVVYALCFIYRLPDLLRGMVLYFPSNLRGFLAPICALVLLCAPCFLGPIFCLVIWSASVYLLLKGSKWLSFLAGIVIVLWGVLIPIQENFSAWLEDPRIETMLSVASKTYSRNDEKVLQGLIAERSDDGILHFVYGQLLRKLGEYQKAGNVIEHAESLLGKQPWTRVERGMLAFLQGEFKKADGLYAEAKSMGLGTPEFLLEYSRVKGELLDPNSRSKFFNQAKEMNPELAVRHREREQAESPGSAPVMNDNRLPHYKFFSSMIIPIQGVSRRSSAIAGAFIPGLDPWGLIILGVLLIVPFFMVNDLNKAARFKTYYHEYKPSPIVTFFIRLVPAGSWIVSGLLLFAFLAISICLFLVMPLIDWPSGSGQILSIIPGFYNVYLGFVVVVMILISGLSLLIRGGK